MRHYFMTPSLFASIRVHSRPMILSLPTLAMIGLSAPNLCLAHDPITTKITWTREISRIFYRRCFACHNAAGKGDAASIPLTNYDEARPWAKAIKDEVLQRRMPPWGPVKGFGDFKNDAGLSSVEIDLIVNWVEGGAPEGEPGYLPKPPNLPGRAPRGPLYDRLAVRGAAGLDRDVTVIGIEPSGPVEAAAHLSSGSIVPLVLIRSFRPGQPKAYFFREPLKLPKGTEIRADGAAVNLLISAPQSAGVGPIARAPLRLSAVCY
jgi:hypothetical protein